MTRRGHQGRSSGTVDDGFTIIELVIAMMIMAVVMFSLTLVLVNSLVDTAYNRQRNEAINLANQTVEEVRALGWSTIQQGMSPSDTTLTATADPNLYNPTGTTTYCFEDQPLDETTTVSGQSEGSIGSQTACAPVAWGDPACLKNGPAPALPSASSLTSPAPISPHQQCYTVGGQVYGIDVYLTGGPGTPAAPPLTATVVVSWAHPIRGGLSDHIVTTTQISSCLTVGANCT